jgi:DNA repair protein RadA/Sms
MGRCNECGAWNSLVEERVADAAPATSGSSRYAQFSTTSSAKLYAEVETAQGIRLSSGIDEFDRVLGGGVVPGSLVLLGGEPGIGKSTLLLQAAAHFAREIGPVLYASGEESEHQIKSRGDRLGVGAAPLYLLSETCIERILEEIARLKPTLVVIDSVQTVWSNKFQSAPGSIGQVREAATQFLFAAKGQNVPTVLVGHVTKDGNLAGPKVLEHVVDTVLYFEGERHHAHRVVRAVKNRFGAVSELGVPRSSFSPSAPRARRAPRCCAVSRARGRFSWRSRRSSAPAPTATRAGWRSASIRIGCRCCWLCSRSALA